MTTGVALAGHVGPLSGLRRSDLPADALRQVEEEEREGRRRLLEGLDGLLAGHEQVGGCLECRDRLRALQRARRDGSVAMVEAFLTLGSFPPATGDDSDTLTIARRTRHMSVLDEVADSRMSVAEWRMSANTSTHEALLRLLFEDPVPVSASDLRALRGTSWRA